MTEKKTLLVTGASGFLGRAVLEAGLLRADVEEVVAIYRRSPVEHPPAGVQVLDGIDLTQEARISRLREAVESLPGDNLVLVHTAGIFSGFAPLHRSPIDVFRSNLDANILSYLGAVMAVIPQMRRHRWGRILAFSAQTRGENYPYMGAFNITKAALESAVKTTANENARFGITANVGMLATLQTEVERAIKPQGHFEDWLNPQAAASAILDIALTFDRSLNGSLLNLWNHSDSFFGKSMLERNSIDRNQIDPDHD